MTSERWESQRVLNLEAAAAGTPVPDSVLDESDQPLVPESVVKGTKIGVEHPVHLLRLDPDGERV